MDALLQDLRYAVRSLRKSPGFTMAAALTLAVGIGANTICFTLLNSLALRPIPVPDAARLVRIFPVDRDGRRQNLFSFPDYVDYRDQTGVFDGLIAYIPTVLTLAAPSGTSDPEEILGYAVSPNYFSTLGVHAAFGRGFLPIEAGANGGAEVIISHSFWKRHFGSDPNVLNKALELNGHAFIIVGVGPRDFFGTEPFEPDLWVPLATQRQIEPGPNLLHDRHADWLLVIGRLRADIRPRAAETAMSVVARRLAASYPAPARTASVAFAAPTFFTIDPGLRPLIALVIAIVGLVLLVACANVANLTLARAVSRGREIAVRLALGATRGQLLRRLLAESGLVALLGGAAGLLLSFWTLRILYPIGVSLLPFRWGTVVLDLKPDLRVFVYTLLVAGASAVLFGLAPALQASRPNVAAAMHDEGAMLGFRSTRSRLRSALVVLQMAVCLMLLVGAALLARALQHAKALDLGFQTSGVVFADYDLQRHGYTPSAAAAFNARLADRARQLPGVTSVSVTSHVPLTGGIRRTAVHLEGEKARPVDTTLSCAYAHVSPTYFHSLGIRVIRGRNFTADESTADHSVVILSDALARRFWPGEDPIGRRLRTATPPATLTVVGVVRDSADAALWREKELSLYLPMQPAVDQTRMHVLAQIAGDSRSAISALRDEARRLDPNLRFEAKPLDDVLRLWILPSRVAAIGAAILGGLALLMASVGVYSVVNHLVCQRTREVGVRMALGANVRDVLRLVLADGMRLTTVGLLVGLAGSLATTRVLTAFLYGLSAVDPLTFAVIPMLITAVAFLACYIPALRAARVDPMIALRAE